MTRRGSPPSDLLLARARVLDSEIPGLLGEGPAGRLLACVGVPTHRNTGSGAPAAVVVRQPDLTLPVEPAG